MSSSDPSGKSDGSAWLLATSTEGGYSVHFPAAFEEFTETGGDDTRHVLKCFFGDYKTFKACKYVFQDATKAKNKYRKIMGNYEFFADALTDATWQSHPSFKASLSNSGEHGEVFALRVKSAVFLLLVSDNETPDCPNLAAMSRRFFDSLSLA